MTEQSRTSGIERFLNLFTEVRPGEARTALLLALNVFLILMAYYILKTVREALILSEGTAELKSYLVRRAGRGAGVRGALLRPSRRQVSAHEVDQHRHGLLRDLSAGLLCAGAARRPARGDLFHLDRHLQPDDRRAVLVVCQRRVLEGGRRAPVRHRRLRRVARRGGRGGRGRAADRALRRAAAHAAGGRRAGPPAAAHQLHRPHRARPPRRPRPRRRRPAQPSTRSRWCSGRAICC